MSFYFQQAIDVLLAFLGDPSLVLTHGVGSALCVAASTEYEYRRPITTRLALVSVYILSEIKTSYMQMLLPDTYVVWC